LSTRKERTSPVMRFWVVMASVLAFILGRTVSGTLVYPPIVIGAVALGAGVLAVVGMVRKGQELLPSAGLTALTGGIMFAAIFGLMWLLS
jgi:hypothetical protein